MDSHRFSKCFDTACLVGCHRGHVSRCSLHKDAVRLQCFVDSIHHLAGPICRKAEVGCVKHGWVCRIIDDGCDRLAFGVIKADNTQP